MSRHIVRGEQATLDTLLARRSARLNDLESRQLEGVLSRQGLRPAANAIGVTVTALEQVRHSGAATPVTVARVRGFLGGLAK